jgi:hypothetical protein
MQATQHRGTIGHITKGQGYMLLAGGLLKKTMHGEHAKGRRQLGGGDKHDGHRRLLKSKAIRKWPHCNSRADEAVSLND